MFLAGMGTKMVAIATEFALVFDLLGNNIHAADYIKRIMLPITGQRFVVK